MESLENHQKSSINGKVSEFEKNLNNYGKIMEFCEIIVVRKLAVRHTSFVCLTASFLAANDGFKL